MICTRLEGGLGNQLFQYAAARALSYRINTDLILDTSCFERPLRGVTPRSFELHHFCNVARKASPNEFRFNPLLHRFTLFSRISGKWRYYIEKGGHYNQEYLALTDQSYLSGYWQSFRYFKDEAAIIARELAPVEPLSPFSETIAQQISATETPVAVHIRRGDYVSLAKAASHHGTLPISYYNLAIRLISNQTNKPKFFVFSDDLKWCQSNLSFDSTFPTFVMNNTGDNAWQDLFLMSQCRHHIIANSSFSWWGAWLADQRWSISQRLVFSPKRWFSNMRTYDLNDLLPAHWIRL
jgi:hypothetical protein